jgi:hypothetical protein
VRELSAGALRAALSSIGVVVTQRMAANAASRWLPLIGAMAVGGYAYFDTLQVARTARRLLEAPVRVAEPTPSG